MALYMMLGTYSGDAVSMINSARTQEAVGLIERVNGQVVSMYAMLGVHDIVMVVNLPGNREAMEVSVGMSRITGIRFTTGPVIPIERFDDMIESRLGEKDDAPDDKDFPGDDPDRPEAS